MMNPEIIIKQTMDFGQMFMAEVTIRGTPEQLTMLLEGACMINPDIHKLVVTTAAALMYDDKKIFEWMSDQLAEHYKKKK